MIIAELSEGIQFFFKFLESVKKKLLIIVAIFLIVAAVAYPVTDYIINDAVQRSLPYNLRTGDITDNFDQLLVVLDGPFHISDLDMDLILKDPNKTVMIYSEPVPISDAEDVVLDVIISNTKSVSMTDTIADYILRNNNTTFDMVLSAVINYNKKGIPTINDLENSSQVFIFQTMPYDEKQFENDIKKGVIDQIGLEFETVTGRPPQFMIMHLEKDEKVVRDAIVVYTKPLEVPLLKLKMSAIIAAIATLPFLF
jgi:hypothetical protein